MSVALLKSCVTQSDVEVAWATYRALILAEVDDTALQDDPAHQLAVATAKHRYQRLYEDWSRQC